MSEFKATPQATPKPHLLSHIEPLQPQLSREKPKVSNAWQKLLISAEKVNQLSEQLEAALFELKIAGSQLKGDKNAHPISNKMFKQKSIVIPYIHYKRPGLIVVTTRKIDLFQQEREADRVAQMLRKRTKRRLKRPIPTTLSKSSNLKHHSPNFIHRLFLTWQKLNLALGRKQTIRDRPTIVNKAISC